MAEWICTACGWEGERKKQLRGSKGLEVLLWSTVLIPGPFYSLWRRSGRNNSCPNCQRPMLVKLSSAEGHIARKKFDLELGIAPKKVEVKKNDLDTFGNDGTRETITKKPVDPEQF